MSYFSANKTIPPSFLDKKLISTGGDDIRVARALAVIHSLEYLVKTQKTDILKALMALQGDEALTSGIKKALGGVAVDAFCRVHGGYSLRGTILDGVTSVIDEVVAVDEPDSGAPGYTVHRGRYQQEFEQAVRAKDKNLRAVHGALELFRDLAPDDFKALRGSLTLETGHLSAVGQGAIAVAQIGMPGRMIEAAEELFLIGYDIDGQPLMDVA